MAGLVVDTAVKCQLNPNQYAALVSFVFNVGPGKKDFKSGFVTLKNGRPSSMLRMLNAQLYRAAAEEFPKWVNNPPLPGLVKRRAAERALFLQEVV
jgi:lysozyme